ncbi:MAG TPA: homoserine dehydrogenase [Syntrophorhabdaceae bacterium]|nr:homoserine dehydrogenase [Syntrophorhabdaceae bacterium]
MIGIGIIGLGTVGTGTYNVLTQNRSLIKQRTGLDMRMIRIAEIDPKKIRSSGVAKDLITKSAEMLIDDENVDIVVELIGGIHPAYDFITRALEKKKWVITANKALLAEKGDELFKTAEANEREIGFEASVCGGIPVIRAIREGLVGNRISYMLGILNGTSNYILTQMTETGMSFDQALIDAQKLGFAEKDPTFDIEGIDAAHKLNILTRLAFSYPIHMKDIVVGGISKIKPIDIFFAREFGYKIKLLAMAKQVGDSIEARVEPAMIPMSHPMSSVNGVFNAVYLIGDKVGPTLFYGKGAGADPTGSAVVSDIVDIAAKISAGNTAVRIPEYKTSKKRGEPRESLVPHYMRFSAEDRPGVLSKVSGILAQYGISISAVTQKERKEGGFVPIVMLTHDAREKDLKKAKKTIDNLSFIKGESVHMRVEEGNL